MMRLILLPLDERPVNTRYPRQLAAIAGATLLLPPSHLLPRLREQADTYGLSLWLAEQAAEVDAVLVSVDLLGYGGLIPSRISHDTSGEILARLDVLHQLRYSHPTLPIYAFNVITRISNADDNIEEPLYWDTYGTRLYRYSQLMHRARQFPHDAVVQAELLAVRDAIPTEIITDFTRRRLRNHLVNLHLLELLADEVLTLLVLSSDDTSEYGFGSQEKSWLQAWAERLELPETRLLMYPGADEIGGVMLLRALTADQPPPRFYVDYAIEADRSVIAPYEDSPIYITVERQISALGGVQTEDERAADFIVAVNTPSRIRREYDPTAPDFASEHARRTPALTAFVERVAAWLKAGRRVIMGDVAYPNGADPDLIDLLLSQIQVAQLAAYGGWNTAGNTLGTALAQGLAAAQAKTAAQQTAQQQFLLHRFIEDWGYQHLVRQQVRTWLENTSGTADITPPTEAAALSLMARELEALLPRLGSLSAGWRLTNLRLPWNRTFEIDFDLERG